MKFPYKRNDLKEIGMVAGGTGACAMGLGAMRLILNKGAALQCRGCVSSLKPCV